MHRAWYLIGSVSLIAVGAGCRPPTRMAVQTKEMPRVDLELSGGNRGYLVGQAPEGAELKTTRQMVETVVEVPSFYKPKRGGSPMPIESIAPPEMEMPDETTDAGAAAVPGAFDTYVVQKGDSLWKIAAKPEIYGKASHWRRIFDANRDVLKNPDSVRPGMKLKIPRGDDGSSSTTYDDEGLTYKK